MKAAYLTRMNARQFAANTSRAATIYAFDVIGKKHLQNKPLFAYSYRRLPDGLHTDTSGNLWAACGDGLQVSDAKG